MNVEKYCAQYIAIPNDMKYRYYSLSVQACSLKEYI